VYYVLLFLKNFRTKIRLKVLFRSRSFRGSFLVFAEYSFYNYKKLSLCSLVRIPYFGTTIPARSSTIREGNVRQNLWPWLHLFTICAWLA